MTNMWNTVEAGAWARDFNYEEYVLLYKKVFPTGTPFKQETYLGFCKLFESTMTKDVD